MALVILLIVVGGVWIATQHPWRRAQGQSATLPDFHGQAVNDSRKAGFTTVEQILGGGLHVGSIYKVQARLDDYAVADGAYRLTLGSLVRPDVKVEALIPPGSLAANPDDGALYDELRQDFALRFGTPTARPAAPQQATQVVVTGVLARAGAGVELRPVLDLHVQ